jgi:hypothetical protein
MSRSDFWSIAVTLIVAGVGYFVSAKATAYTCIGLGVITILVLLLTPKKSEPATSYRATQNANPQMTANPHVSQNINLHLPGSEKQEKPIPPPAKPKPQHNLKLHSCKMARIEDNMGPRGEMSGFRFAEDQSSPNAAVVFIKNKSKEGEVAYIDDVRAALIFKDSDRKEIGQGVHQACWVDNHLKNASFALEETKCVILLVIQNGTTVGDQQVTSPYVKEHIGSYGNYGGLSVEPCYLDKNVDFVELILLARGNRVMEPMTFELTVEDNKPGIRLISDDERHEAEEVK